MPIQLTKSRRGLYNIEEYATYRGRFKDSTDNLIPLAANYEPIIYMKCSNGHPFPIRPEDGHRYMPYQEFLDRDLIINPLDCPTCHSMNLIFKYCILDDQPITWNDPNHAYIKDRREVTENPKSDYFQNYIFVGIARSRKEDYFPPDHAIAGTLAPGNHKDPFAEHEVLIQSGALFYSPSAAITSAIPMQPIDPPNNIMDASGKYIDIKKGSINPGFSAEPVHVGKYLKIKQNYEFYRAIVYIISQSYII